MIVPALLRDADRSIDFKVIDADEFGGDAEEKDEDGRKTLNLKVKGVEGAKQVSMNTDVLEVKINSIQILKNLARNLTVHFFDYVEDVAKLCL